MNNEFKRIMEEKKLRYQDISNKTKIGRTTLYQIANKKSVPNIEFALKLARCLNVPVTELFYLDDEE